jgi:sulfite exporter TauE/SafE
MDLSLSLLAGLLGSFHCVGMCGGIVLAYSTAPRTGAIRPAIFSSLPAHLSYNGGRVLSYTLIGALMGIAGGLIGSVQAIGMWFSLVGGCVMIASGLVMLGVFPWLSGGEGRSETWLRRTHVHAVANLLSLSSLESKFYIGLLTPFLPCGLLYSMFLKAATTGNALQGALTMLYFGAGIVPALLLTGLVSAYAGIWLRHYATKLAAVTIIIMGIVMILRGLPFPFLWEGHSHFVAIDRCFGYIFASFPIHGDVACCPISSEY